MSNSLLVLRGVGSYQICDFAKLPEKMAGAKCQSIVVPPRDERMLNVILNFPCALLECANALGNLPTMNIEIYKVWLKLFTRVSQGLWEDLNWWPQCTRCVTLINIPLRPLRPSKSSPKVLLPTRTERALARERNMRDCPTYPWKTAPHHLG